MGRRQNLIIDAKQEFFLLLDFNSPLHLLYSMQQVAPGALGGITCFLAFGMGLSFAVRSYRPLERPQVRSDKITAVMQSQIVEQPSLLFAQTPVYSSLEGVQIDTKDCPLLLAR
jgi:hypothetical protein